MSDFSRNVDDYIDFYPADIRQNYGDTALDAVMNAVKSQFDQLIMQIEFAGSDEERDFAIEQLQDFEFSESEALSIAEDYELDFLENYMSQSYKFNQELIDRYVELTGAGRSSSPSSTPTPAETPTTDEISEVDEIEEDSFDLLDIYSEDETRIGSFFDEFF